MGTVENSVRIWAQNYSANNVITCKVLIETVYMCTGNTFSVWFGFVCAVGLLCCVIDLNIR